MVSDDFRQTLKKDVKKNEIKWMEKRCERKKGGKHFIFMIYLLNVGLRGRQLLLEA